MAIVNQFYDNWQQKVGIILIWLKRFTPLVIILAGWLFFHFYSGENETKKADDDQKYALLTAQVWVASAKYRSEPEKFKEYRDSLLLASGLDNQKAIDYIKQYENSSDQLVNFADLVNFAHQ